MKSHGFWFLFFLVLCQRIRRTPPKVVCWHDWLMRLRIRTVLRYPWPDSWGAFSGRSGFCFRASAIAVIFFVFCFQRLVREFCPDVSANTLFRTYVYVWDKNFKLCGAADSGSDLSPATDCALSTVSEGVPPACSDCYDSAKD